MINLKPILKVIFYLSNIILIFFYLYPGSIFGYILYGDLKQQPQITNDFFNISSNHFYVFIFLSLVGILAYAKNQKIIFIIKYLFLLSIILELFHILIPERSFEFSDLGGNFLGVLLVSFIYYILKNN